MSPLPCSSLGESQTLSHEPTCDGIQICSRRRDQIQVAGRQELSTGDAPLLFAFLNFPIEVRMTQRTSKMALAGAAAGATQGSWVLFEKKPFQK